MSLESNSWSVTGPTGTRGTVRVPGDKSISHRALMLGAVADGVTEISGLSTGLDVRCTADSLRALGVEIRHEGTKAVVVGAKDAFSQPESPLDLGNAGTGIRLFCGLLVGRSITVTLTGDDSLRARPMDRVIEPLRAMGAEFKSRGGFAPLTIVPSRLCGITYRSPVASAQVKSAILLAGLRAEGPTTVVESVPTRPHTEEMLADFAARVSRQGDSTTVWASTLRAAPVAVPGDPSQAAFWTVAASILPDSDVTLPGVLRSHTRTGFVEVLSRMGAEITVNEDGYRVRYQGRLRATDIRPDEVASLVDEVPILAVAAASAEGTSVFQGLGELVHKESNRFEAIRQLLDLLSVPCRAEHDSLAITGTSSFRPFAATSGGDHRMAMAAYIAALHADGESTISGVECVNTSYPGFLDDAGQLTGLRS